ncbi:MAG: YfhO family protein [Oscillospiraceae bacterium]|nr:YfhO family protein [Oscillospiraceae bacterium]
MKSTSIQRKQWLLLALSFVLPALILMLIFTIQGFAPFGKSSLLITDMSQQYIDFFSGYRDILAQGKSLFYTWDTGLGMNMLGLIAYYLSSPFTFVILLFPKSMIIEAVTVISLLKTGACGLSFTLFLRSFRKGGRARIPDLAFALMYALMSYNIIYFFNIMWIDGAVLLPLILLGIERLLDRGTLKLLIFSLTVMFIANFYIAFMVGIGALLWFILGLVRRWPRINWQYSLKKFGLFLLCALVAAGVAAVLLLPSYFALSNAYGEMSSLSWGGQIRPVSGTLQRMLFASSSSVTRSGSANIYCGILPLVAMPIYFANKKIAVREKLAAVLILLIFFISFTSWDVSNLWHCLREPTWFNFRFSFIYCAFLLFFAWRGFTHLSKVKILVPLLSLLGWVIFALCLWFYSKERSISKEMLLMNAVLITTYSICFLAMRYRKVPKGVRMFLSSVFVLCICAEMYLNGAMQLLALNNDNPLVGRFEPRAGYTEAAKLQSEIVAETAKLESGSSEFYRTENQKMRWSNDGLAAGYHGMAHYSSLSNRSTFHFLHGFGMLLNTGDRYLRYFGATNLTDDLLGIKYVSTMKERRSGYTQAAQLDGAVLVKNENALPLGYAADAGVLNYRNRSNNPYTNQSSYLAAILGKSELALFTPVKKVVCTPVDMDDSNGYLLATSDDSAYVISFKNPKEGQVYANILCSFGEETPIYINGERLGRPVDDFLNGVIPVGHFEKDAQIELKLKIDKGISGTVWGAEVYNMDTAVLDKAIAQIKESPASFTANGSKVTGTIDMQTEGVILTSIPYDSSWKAELDGKPVQIKAVDSAFIAIPASAGAHTLKMQFIPKGFRSGLVISIFAFIFGCVIIFISDFDGVERVRRLRGKRRK